MPIKVRCSCGKSYNVADKLAGKKFKCKGCDNVLAVRRPAPRAKAKAAGDDADSGFLDMDLDSEFSRMASVQRPQTAAVEDEPYDITQERDYRYVGEAGSDEELRAKYQPHSAGVERSAALVLGILGIVIGVGLIAATIVIRVKFGWRIRGLAWLGGASLVGGIGMVVKGF